MTQMRVLQMSGRSACITLKRNSNLEKNIARTETFARECVSMGLVSSYH